MVQKTIENQDFHLSPLHRCFAIYRDALLVLGEQQRAQDLRVYRLQL